jgi:hypothetical protein
MIAEYEQGVEEGWDARVANSWGVWDGKDTTLKVLTESLTGSGDATSGPLGVSGFRGACSGVEVRLGSPAPRFNGKPPEQSQATVRCSSLAYLIALQNSTQRGSKVSGIAFIFMKQSPSKQSELLKQ